MPISASGSYSLPTLRFQNLQPGPAGAGTGGNLHTLLVDMGAGIREARIQGGGGGGGVSSLTACVGDILATALVPGTGLTLSAGAHTVELKISAVESTMIPSFTACVRDAANSGLVAGNGITFSTSGHSLEIKTATITAGQILSFTANVGQAANAGLLAGTAIVLSFNAATNVTEIRASITSGGGIASFTACVGDAMFPNLKAGTNVSYSFNAGTHQTEINVSGSLGAISSFTTSVQQIVTLQSGVRYIHDYGAIGDGFNHPISESFSTTASAIAFFPYMTSLADEKDYSALLTALYDAPGGSGEMVHVHCRNGDYIWGEHTFTPARPIRLTGEGTMEGGSGTYFLRYPVGHGIKVSNAGGAGSIFMNFELSHTLVFPGVHKAWGGGLIREYNPLTGVALLAKMDAASTITSSVTHEFRPLLGMADTATGKFYCTGIKDAFGVPARTIEILTNPSSFTAGETISWAGGSCIVCWTGYRARVLGTTTYSGSAPLPNTVITGGTSGATSTVVEERKNATSHRPVVLISGLMDDADGNSEDLYESYTRKGQFGHGILFTQRAYCDNVRVTEVTGNGFYIAAGGGGYSGNANLSRLHRCLAANLAGNGVAVIGADANVVTVSEGTMTECGGYGIVDNTFLGAIIYGNHISQGGIGAFYLGGGNSISFGNYTEGTEDKIPLRRRITRVLEGHLDMMGTDGNTAVTRAGGARMTANSFKSDWLNYSGGTNSVFIRNTGSGLGGTNAYEAPNLVVENGGDRGSGAGASIEIGIPLDNATHEDYGLPLAHPGARLVVNESGGTCRGLFKMFMSQGIGSNVVRARSGSSFRGRVWVAGAGTITSVEVLATGASATTFSDTLSISNPGAGAGAVLIPIVRRGKIVSVHVANGGSGYTNSIQFRTAFEARDDYFSFYAYDGNPAQVFVTCPSATSADLSLIPWGSGTVRVPKVNLAGVCNITTSTSLTASSDLVLTPAGNGRVRFGTFTSTAVLTVTGYIEITDAGGTIRRLAVLG